MNRIPISPETAASRLQFARLWRGNEVELMAVFFSDEASIQNQPNNPRGWVFRKPYEKFQRAVVNVTIHGKAKISLMVFAVIYDDGRSDLIFMERDETVRRRGYTSRSYQKALEEGLLPIWDPIRRFQQDNARIHNFGGTPEWLASNPRH